MKKQFLALLSAIVLTAAGVLHAQKIQLSTVREQNSNKRPVPNTQVIFSDAVPASSDQSGNLRLVFKDKKAGDWVFLTEATKAGYELVNNKEIEQVKLSGDDRFGVDIILAKTGVVDAAKKEYYGISDKALLVGFEKEKRRLRSELGAAKLSQEQYEQQYKQVQEQYDRQKESLDALSEKFARVNFDDVDSLYREALELFKAGEIEQCKKKLENANLIGRTNLRLQERERITGAEQEIARQKADNEKGIRQDIDALKLQAQTYLLTFELGKAEGLFDQLLLLDSTDLSILQDAADFYGENHRYEKALRFLPFLIVHPQAEEWQKANAYGNMGVMYTAIGLLEPAMRAYLASQKAYVEMLKASPNHSLYKQNLAIPYSKLGSTYTALGNLDKALKYYEDRSKLGQELYAAYPYNVDFKNGLAISYSKLGETYTTLGNWDKALKYYEDYNSLETELHTAHPNNVDFKNGLAISYSKLGDTYITLGNLGKALKYYENDLQLTQELYTAYPYNVDFKNGLAISYSKLGETHTALGNLDKTLKYYEDRSKLGQELYAAYPNNVDFKNGLAISYSKLGETHTALGNLDRALKYYEDYNSLEAELHAAYPNNVPFKNGLAISYEKLGDTHTALGDLDKALTYYENEVKLFEQLYAAYPNNVDLKNGLAISYYKLGTFSRDNLHNKPKTKDYFQQAERFWTELVRDAPQYADFQRFLTMIRKALADLEEADDTVFLLNVHIQNETDTLALYQLYGTLCDTLRQRVKSDPVQKAALADALNSQAVWSFSSKICSRRSLCARRYGTANRKQIPAH